MVMPHQEEIDCLEHLPSTHDLVTSLGKDLLDIDGVQMGTLSWKIALNLHWVSKAGESDVVVPGP